MAMTRRMNAFRSHPRLARRCQKLSGLCTTPISRPATTSCRYSGRTGGAGTGRRVTAARISAMGNHLLLLDAIRKQDIVNAVGKLDPALGIDGVAAVAVELALDLTRMRGQQQ